MKKMTMMTKTSSRSLRLTTLAAVAAILVCAFPHMLEAKDKKKDEPYALIFGTVFGPDMRPVQGITVKIRRSDQKKSKWELLSDRRGEFAQRVPAGRAEYLITLQVPKTTGLTPAQEAYSVKIDNDERQDIVMHLK
jgi:hypothetical protein